MRPYWVLYKHILQSMIRSGPKGWLVWTVCDTQFDIVTTLYMHDLFIVQPILKMLTPLESSQLSHSNVELTSQKLAVCPIKTVLSQKLAVCSIKTYCIAKNVREKNMGRNAVQQHFAKKVSRKGVASSEVGMAWVSTLAHAHGYRTIQLYKCACAACGIPKKPSRNSRNF